MALFRSLALMLAASLLLTGMAQAQSTPSTEAAPSPFTTEELDSMLAPIALYPDSLLAQVLMASTYPLEVVQAARWSKANPKLNGDEAVKKVGDEKWDVSVMSLVAFPNVLEMMNDKLDWTQKVGDAFLGQQGEVMDSVQRLRKLAQNSGNLQSNEQQVVRSEAQAIIIEPAQPQTIYVPAYNPTVVYGAWPYPAYPPYYYPGVAAWYPGTALASGIAWGVGIAAAGAIFGGYNWGHGDVDIDINRATNIDRNYNRNNANANGKWQHNAEHRGNVGYRDQKSRDRFSGGRASGADSRRDFRGFDGDRGGNRDGIGGGDRGGNRDGIGGGDRGGGRDGLPSHTQSDRGNMSNRGTGSAGNTNRASALDGVNRGNRDSSRGRSSAGQMGSQGHSFGGGGGGARPTPSSGGARMGGGGGGGFSRGGGGGRGGGGRR